MAPYRIYNIGSGRSVPLMRYVEVLEQCLGRRADKQMLPAQPGDVPVTSADCAELFQAIGYEPQVDIEEGVAHFVRWYREFYGVGA